QESCRPREVPTHVPAPSHRHLAAGAGPLPALRAPRPADAGGRADGAGRPAGRRDLVAAARAAGRGLVRDRRGRGPALALADDAGAARAAVVERGLSTHSITFRSRGPPWRCGVRAAGARAVRL